MKDRTPNPRCFQISSILMLMVVAVIFNSSHAMAQSAQDTEEIPLYPGLVWRNQGISYDSPDLQGESTTLPGTVYESDLFQQKLPTSIFAFYRDSLGNANWAQVDEASGLDGLTEVYHKGPDRYLTVQYLYLTSTKESPGGYRIRIWIAPPDTKVSVPPKGAPLPLPQSPADVFDPKTPSNTDVLVTVPRFSQNDTRWSNNQMGWQSACQTQGITLGRYGCWTTSYAMLYNYYSPNYTTPANLNSSLNTGAIRYGSNGAGCSSLMPGGSPYAPVGVTRNGTNIYNYCVQTNCIDPSNVTMLDNELNGGRPVLLFTHYFDSWGYLQTHMVVLIGHSAGTWYINDPGDGSQRTLSSGYYAPNGYVVDWIYRWNGNPPSQPPSPPANARATALDPNRIHITWNDTPNETGYRIYDATTLIATVGANTTSYVAGGLIAGSYHCYVIVSYNGIGASLPSNFACATTPNSGPPPQVTNARATALDPNRIHITWNDTPNETGYRIYDGGTQIATVGANSISYTVGGLAPGSYRCYRVAAYNASGQSNPSDWACATTPQQQVVEVIVDDQSSGFARGGTYWWDDSSRGYGGHMFWTCVNGNVVTSWGTWRPNLPTTRLYEVFVHIPDFHTNTNSASYTVRHSYGSSLVIRPQAPHSNVWVSLGTFTFSAGTSGYVQLTDATGETPSCNVQIGFDAVKWVPR